MATTRKQRQSSRKLLGQLDDIDQDVIIGNTVSDSQRIVLVIIVTSDEEFTVGKSVSNPAAIENLVNVKTLERCYNEMIDRKLVIFLILSNTKFKTQF